MSETVKVIVRCRPMNGRENGLKCSSVVNINTTIGQCAITNIKEKNAKDKTFTFDGSFGDDSTTEQIYSDIAYPLVEGVTEGYNGTIFAYGQTGCGKSFTMQGITDPESQRGIIPRAFDHIFETIQISQEIQYLVHASYLEIYNEDVRDLLGKDSKQKLELKEHPEKGVYIQDLSKHTVKNVHDCERVMMKGWKNRAVGSTAMNAESSRSHSIFTIHLERSSKDETGEDRIRAAKLNLVDLAGSERQAKTGATGDRLKEATKINLSLSALGNVISSLVDGKSKHIPYRDSKLTRLLQDSLGGNTKTLMVACLSPADNNYDETLSTLRYANRAKNIKNKPKINEDPKDALLREYQDEIEKLRAMLRGDIPVQLLKENADDKSSKRLSNTKTIEKFIGQEEMENEKQRLEKEYQNEINDLKNNYESMKVSKDNLELEMQRLKMNLDSDLAVVHDAQTTQSDSSETSSSVEGNSIVSTEVPTNQKKKQSVEKPRKSSKTQKKPVEVDESGDHLDEEESQLPQADTLLRLQELEGQFVRGENNENIRQKHSLRTQHAEDRRLQLADAIKKLDGEDILMDIYENVHDELRAKTVLIEREREKCDLLREDIRDLQSEFEIDRIDYLDTIRKQEQQMKWLQGVLDNIHPCLRKDSNYVNLDRIRVQSSYDYETLMWNMPKMSLEKTSLAHMAGMKTVNNNNNNNNGYEPFEDNNNYEKLKQKLETSNEQDMANNYFKNKRTEKLLSRRDQDNRSVSAESNHNQSLPPSWLPQNQTNLRLSNGINSTAQGHGQPNDELPIRKPVRLESLHTKVLKRRN